jgi:hypothetical protein
MSIEIDDARFQQLLDLALVARGLDPHEVRVVVDIAQLAASIDLDDDPEERTLLHTLTRRLCAWGGISPSSIRPLSPVPTDDEERAARIAVLAQQLVTAGARDLAFAVAYLVIVADLELSPGEGSLLDGLEHELELPRARARELAGTAARIVTPDEQAAPDAAGSELEA